MPHIKLTACKSIEEKAPVLHVQKNQSRGKAPTKKAVLLGDVYSMFQMELCEGGHDYDA